MRSNPHSVFFALAASTLVGGFFLGRCGWIGIPAAMAQGACCPNAAPVSSVLQDAPAFGLRDPAHDAPSSALAAVCATPAVTTGGYRTIIVHVPSCATPVYAQYALGQAGFVTQASPQLACNPTTTPGVRGAAAELDATLGTSFRLATPAAKTGACPSAAELKVTVAGVR